MKGGGQTAGRWRQNRQVIAPADAFVADLAPLRRTSRARGEVAALAAGSPVILCSSPPFARRRCRHFAAAAGIDLHGEYLALPTAGAPAYLVEDAPAATTYFLRSILVPLPGRIWTVPFRLCLSAISRLPNPGRVVRPIAPRVMVGTRR